MRLVVDTNVVIWHAVAPERIPARVHSALDNRAGEVLISAVVPWEIAIKRSLGRLLVDERVVDDLLDAGATPLPISFEHAAAVEHLPHHHGDPFGRLLVAQAQIEGATIISADAQMAAYDVPVLWG